MHSPTPSSLLILRWSTSYKAPAKAVLCLARTTVTLAAITHGAAAVTLNISSVAMLVSVLKDLLWTQASLVSISSRTRQPTYLFTGESITIIPSALSLAHLHCGIRFHARVSRLMHGAVLARFSAAAKGTNFTRRDRRTPSPSMHKPTISAAKPKCSLNSAPASKFDLRGTSVG